MALDIAVVGLGQAGGNIAAEFFRRGYRALALNTAQTDLVALEPGGVYPTLPADRRLYIGIDGYDGAGADPSYGRECIAEHSERIRNAILKQASQADVVIVAAGLGGGTGSSIAELIRVMKGEELPIVALVTLPTEGESGIAKVNAVRAINELVDAPLLGWVFVDNARIGDLNQDISVVDYFAHINGQIASPIDALNRLNDRDEIKAIRSFDGEDFRKLILSGGVLNYGVVTLPSITTEEVVGTIRDAIEASELMPAGFEMSRLSYLGIVIEASESVLAGTPISVFEEIHERLKKETGGAAVYHGLYRSSEEGAPTLRLIAATQGLPSRMRQILADAKREGSKLGEKLREELPTLELGEIEDFELFRTTGNNPSSRPRRTQSPRAIDVADAIVATGPHGESATEDGVIRKELGQDSRLADPRPVDPRVMRQRRPVRPQPSAPARPQPGAPPRPQPSRTPAQREAPAPREARPAAPKPPAPVDDDLDDDQVADKHELATGEIDLNALAAVAQNVSASDVIVGTGRVHADDEEPATGAGLLPTSASKDPVTSERANPEIYERLIAEFKAAKQGKQKDEIMRRLEIDSLAEQTVIRYYAVEAMARLGRDIFGSQLLAATEDENDAVRAIAVEALRR